MKTKHIQGKIISDKVVINEEKLEFSIAEVHLWTDEGEETFLGGVRAYEMTDLSDIKEVSLICWNRKKDIICTLPINLDVFQQGRIAVDNWQQVLNEYRNQGSEVNGFFILKCFVGEEERNYILGGIDKCNGFFSKKKQRKHLLEGDLEASLTRRHIAEDNWVFELVNGKDYINRLVKNEVIQKVYLDVADISWENHGMKIRTLPESEQTVEMNHIKQYLLLDNSTGLYTHEKTQACGEANSIFFGMDFTEKLRTFYEEKNKLFRVNIFPVYSKGDTCVIYEFRVQKNFKKNTNYNRESQFAEYFVMDALEEQKIAIMPYYTTGGYLRIVVIQEYQMFNELYKAEVKDIRIQKGILKLKFLLAKSEYQLKDVSLILRSSLSDKRYSFTLEKVDKKNKWLVRASLDLSGVDWEQFYWDIRGIVEKDGKEYELRLCNYSKWMKLKMLLAPKQYQLPGSEYLVFPYMAKSRDFALMYRLKSEQDSVKFIAKEYLALFLFCLLRPYWVRKNLWLVYEKYSVTAQDNSYYFFKYCMEQLPEKERKHIYYVIDKNASDYQYVEQYGKKVIQFLSLKHMIYLKAAKLLISSDTKAHAYAWHSPTTLYRYMISWKRNVFLQHGVIYYKQCHQGLKKSGTNNCKLFIVSSEVEKEIIRKYFGYKNNEIAVTGLARWDVLQDTSVDGEKMILMMPTWRNWLEEVTQEEFCQSDYYKNYMELLNAPRLHKFLEEKNVKLVFYIHPKFREYIGAFATSSPHIEMIEFGTQPLNELLMQCNMMITDYSSACWDVYYQEKPVLFYMFDYEMYNEVQGSYVDMRTEAFGEATDSLETLISLMEEYEANNFTEKEEYAELREMLLPYRDHQNCERTYWEIKKKFYKKEYHEMLLSLGIDDDGEDVFVENNKNAMVEVGDTEE